MAVDMGIDPGSTGFRLYVKGKGVVVDEPAVACVNRQTKEILSFGREAYSEPGLSSGNLSLVYPVRQGRVADPVVLRGMISLTASNWLDPRQVKKPSIAVAIPCGITKDKEEEILNAVAAVGVSEVQPVLAPVAAAVGAGIEVTHEVGNMIVDLGGGKTDIAVFSSGDPIVNTTLKEGGATLNRSIKRFLSDRYDFRIGEQTAERVKVEVGTVAPPVEEKTILVDGREADTGLEKQIGLTSGEVWEAMKNDVDAILNAIQAVLAATPLDLTNEIQNRGIVLTGGGAKLNGWEERIREEIGFPVMTAEDPEKDVIRGMGKLMEKDEL